MKLEEWKKFLDSIPDNEYTRKFGYIEFKDSPSVDAEDPGAVECFVTLEGKQIYPVRANSEKGFIETFKIDSLGTPTTDEKGDLQTERIYGNVKIVKYAYKL